ncbi:uncharacterized protein F5147DRAFT_775479 [Suillus discolor]|uniref:Uncharacterized protein n=1 Tax=Suillus discolor TaxID=1912936 RepID=A0A9P7F360_9AGAM|nr:uncharacterized protein F5147DRAFT_775479 [Suillus discolor]KAG2104658.1 hypothetical protein F5147DRAFT_775479 [Suillus discolor]
MSPPPYVMIVHRYVTYAHFLFVAADAILSPNKTYDNSERKISVTHTDWLLPPVSLTQPTLCSTMLLQRFPVRSGSSNNKTGGSQPRRAGLTSGLLTPATAGGPRGRSLSASFQRPPATGTTSLIQRECSLLGMQPGSHHSASHTVVDGPGGSIMLQTPSEASLNEPIMAGMCHWRTDSDDGFNMAQSLFAFTDKTTQVDFIKNHCEVFKLPAALMQDVELLAQLSKIVSELLSSIRGNLKAKLVILIAKQYAFLQRCLRIFLIGVSDYKAIPLKDLYSSSLIPSLHKDLRIKIAMTLDCEVGTEADENGEQHGDQPGVSNDTGGDGDLGEGGHVMDNREEDQFRENHDEEAGQQEPDEDYDDDNNNNSGSGFSKRKNAIRKAAREEAGPEYTKSAHRTYENAVRNLLVEFFQMDLVEFPGSMVVPKLLKTTSPQWQTTIQDSLLWG